MGGNLSDLLRQMSFPPQPSSFARTEHRFSEAEYWKRGLRFEPRSLELILERSNSQVIVKVVVTIGSILDRTGLKPTYTGRDSGLAPIV